MTEKSRHSNKNNSFSKTVDSFPNNQLNLEEIKCEGLGKSQGYCRPRNFCVCSFYKEINPKILLYRNYGSLQKISLK